MIALHKVEKQMTDVIPTLSLLRKLIGNLRPNLFAELNEHNNKEWVWTITVMIG